MNFNGKGPESLVYKGIHARPIAPAILGNRAIVMGRPRIAWPREIDDRVAPGLDLHRSQATRIGVDQHGLGVSQVLLLHWPPGHLSSEVVAKPQTNRSVRNPARLVQGT